MMAMAMDRRPSVAPEFYLRQSSNPRFLGTLGDDSLSPTVGWTVAGGLLLGAIVGVLALGVINKNHHHTTRRR